MEKLLWGKYIAEDDFNGDSLIKAKNRETGETVAIKRFSASREEAVTEMRVWRDIYPEDYRSHFTEKGSLYLERAWIEGETLFDHVEGHGCPGEKQALLTAQKIAEELQFFYEESGLVYGDLKPENVIVTESGVRLIDFESAAAERIENRRSPVVKTKTVRFVTPGFSAPECIRGEQTVRSDIYSLGRVLLFMLTGTLSEEGPKVSDGVRELVSRLTETDPEMRPVDMNAVIQMIDEAEPKGHGGVLFRNMVFGYRRLIIYVRDNVCFSTELASVAAACGLKVGFFEFCDTGDGVAEYYFERGGGTKARTASEPGEADTFCAAEEEVSYDSGESCRQVFAETRRCASPEDFDTEKMRDFVLNCYSDFDLTVICDSTEITPESRAQLMRFSDYCLLTAAPDAGGFEEQIKKTRRFAENYAVPTKRLKTVAWEYREGESLSETILRTAAGEGFAGLVDYDKKRRGAKNLSGEIYSSSLPEKVRRQYLDIIGEILPLTQRQA